MRRAHEPGGVDGQERGVWSFGTNESRPWTWHFLTFRSPFHYHCWITGFVWQQFDDARLLKTEYIVDGILIKVSRDFFWQFQCKTHCNRTLNSHCSGKTGANIHLLEYMEAALFSGCTPVALLLNSTVLLEEQKMSSVPMQTLMNWVKLFLDVGSLWRKNSMQQWCVGNSHLCANDTTELCQVHRITVLVCNHDLFNQLLWWQCPRFKVTHNMSLPRTGISTLSVSLSVKESKAAPPLWMKRAKTYSMRQTCHVP